MTKPLDYIVTFSGREVSLTRGVPSIEDLALSLSRQPRFGGMCRRHWTVLDHSLFTALLAERDGQPANVQLACLLHDAHEWTGDIPTHFKTSQQRELQQSLDARIFDAYMPPSVGMWGSKVKEYDHRALLAEAMVVGPPEFKTSEEILEHFGERPRLRDVVALLNRIRSGELGVDPSEQKFFNAARNTHAFLKRVRMLQDAVQQQTTKTTPPGFVANETRGNTE